MKKRHWPSVSADYPDSILDHAGCLHDDLEAINTFARDSQSSEVINSKLPHTFDNKIFNGITYGIHEALSNDILPKDLSAKRQVRLRDTIGRHITKEAGYKARDRVPLSVFSSLLDSYSELLIKLWDSPALRKQVKEPSLVSLSDGTTQGESESQSEEGSDTSPDARDSVDNFNQIQQGHIILMDKTGIVQGTLKHIGPILQGSADGEDCEEVSLEDGSEEGDYNEHGDSTKEENREGGSGGLHGCREREQEKICEDQATKAERLTTDTPREARTYTRNILKENPIFERCTRCQSLDHQRRVCNAPFKCAKCAKGHKTRNCRSKVLKCANCQGPHGAFSVDCPARVAGYSNMDDFRSGESLGSAIQHESTVIPDCSINQDLPLSTSFSAPLSLYAGVENVQPESNFKIEESSVDRSTECSISAADVDSLPPYQPTEIKAELRASPRQRDHVKPPHTIQDLEQELLNMNAALLRLQGQMKSYKKRSSGGAFPEPDLSKVGRDVKRFRQDVDYAASLRDFHYPDYYRP